MPNKVLTSEVSNPLFFPLAGFNTVGTGKILGIASATKALSQGQFGQFPLYAFTSDGIWALQTADNGLYSACHPVSRDVCSNPAMITSVDSAVVFPSSRGLMCLAGAEVSCLSTPLNAPDVFSPVSLPHFKVLSDLFSHDYSSVNDCFDFVTLYEYLTDANAGIVYDYIHKRLIIFSPARQYAYVFSFVSSAWATIDLNIKATVNAFPQALVSIDNSNSVADFAAPDDIYHNTPFLLVSRPLSFGDKDSLKAVNSIIIRGIFPLSNLKSMLFASRDLFNWFPIWSSKNNILRGFSGTPYRFFRIALVGNMNADNSIAYASVKFSPKLTNKPR